MLIGEVARASGVSTRMLRHYDALGLVRPSGRTAGGYRDYSDADVGRLFQVEALRSLGLSLGQIGRALAAPEVPPTDLVDELIALTRRRIDQARELLDKLTAIQSREPTDWAEVLDAVELMRELDSVGGAQRQQRFLMQAFQDEMPTGVLVDTLLSEDDPNVAGTLRWAIARSGTAGLAALREAAHSSNVDGRRRAVLAITELTDTPEVSTELEECLGDPDPTIRRYAAVALGRRGTVSAVPVLVSLIVEGDHDVEAAETLGLLAHHTSCGDSIIKALSEKLDEPSATQPSRIHLTQALIEIGTPAAREILATLSLDPDPYVARIAAAFTNHPPRESRQPDHSPSRVQ